MPNLVLIVDDCPDTRSLLKSLLANYGFKAYTASDAIEAREILKENEIDVVLQDLYMPDVDGFTFSKEILNLNPFIKIIIISAYASIDIAINAMQSGIFYFLEKPIQRDRLIFLIKKALRIKHLEEQNKIDKKKLYLTKNIEFVLDQLQFPEKKLTLDKIHISSTALHGLYRVLMQFVSIARHDLNNNIANLLCYVDIMQVSLNNFKGSKREDDKNSKSDLLIGDFEHIVIKLSELINNQRNQLKFLFGNISTDNMNNFLISKPSELIKKNHLLIPEMNIHIGKNCIKSLEILFPESVLFSIIQELLNNIKAVVVKNPEVFISWRLKKNLYICDIHDNGSGIVNHLNYFPMFLEDLKINTSGLKIINGILRRVNGNLIFLKSKLLKGTHVRIVIPVMAAYFKGRIYEFTEY